MPSTTVTRARTTPRVSAAPDLLDWLRALLSFTFIVLLPMFIIGTSLRMLVTDRDLTGNGPIIPFFGQPTHFPEGAAVISLRTGAPILIAVAVRKANGRFDAWMEPLPPVERTGDLKQDALRVTQAVAERLEYYVAKHPEQWTVFQRRWGQASSGSR